MKMLSHFDQGRSGPEDVVERREFYVSLGLLAVGIALVYGLGVEYREGWTYWVGIPALTAAIGAAGWLVYTLFKRSRRG